MYFFSDTQVHRWPLRPQGTFQTWAPIPLTVSRPCLRREVSWFPAVTLQLTLPLFTAIKKRRFLVNIRQLYFSSVPSNACPLIFQHSLQRKKLNCVTCIDTCYIFFPPPWINTNSVILQNHFRWAAIRVLVLWFRAQVWKFVCSEL